MIRKLLIQALVPKGNATLVGNYYDKKTRKNLYLVDGGKRVCTDNDYDDDKIHNVLISDGQVHTHEYDDAIKSELAIVEFYKNHPLCRTVGSTNPNLVNGLFTIIIHHEVVEKDIFELDRNLDIAIEMIEEIRPGTHHYISTIGVKGSDFSWIKGNITLQVSLHSCVEDKRNWLIPFKRKMTIAELGQIRTESNLKTTLNMTLVDDADFDIVTLKNHFANDKFFVKLSPINENEISKGNALGKGIIKATNLV
jgi:hypothetical protein